MKSPDEAGSRARIVAALRGGSQTVAELAELLGITDNGVRSHLLALQRDGIVAQAGNRKGFRKPHFSYELTSEARGAFAKAQGPVLDSILTVFERALPAAMREEMLRDAGKGLAGQNMPPKGAGRRERLAHALALLAELGGLASLEEGKDGCTIVGNGCPLHGVVVNHPEACLIAESMLQELIGAKVESRCRHQPSPQCCFHVRG